jgi:hypothetical protein
MLRALMLGTILLVPLFALGGRPASACVCLSDVGIPEQGVAFYGEPLRTIGEGPTIFIARHILRGQPSDGPLFEVWADQFSSCAVGFEEGESYLVYAGASGASGRLTTNLCGVWHGEEAQDRLQVLGVMDDPLSRALDNDRAGSAALLAGCLAAALALRLGAKLLPCQR